MLFRSEIEAGFRRDFHLLTSGHGLNRSSTPGADACSDRRAFSTSSQAADQSADSGATANNGGRTLAARSALLLNVTCGERVGLSLIGKALERNCKFAAPLEFSRGTGIDEFQCHVEALGDDDLVTDDDGRVERTAERFAGGACGGVNRINGADRDDRAFGNGDRDRLRRWRRMWWR